MIEAKHPTFGSHKFSHHPPTNMEPTARYEILQHLPPYGPMYIPISLDGQPYYSEGYPVRFFTSDGKDWVANFQPGWTDLEEVIELSNTPNLLIIAYGACYLINPDETEALDKFGVDYAAVFKASLERYVLQGQTDLTIIEPDGSHWRTERISWDGLEELQVENNMVKGLCFHVVDGHDEWDDFIYDLDTRVLTRGSFKSSERMPQKR